MFVPHVNACLSSGARYSPQFLCSSFSTSPSQRSSASSSPLDFVVSSRQRRRRRRQPSTSWRTSTVTLLLTVRPSAPTDACITIISIIIISPRSSRRRRPRDLSHRRTSAMTATGSHSGSSSRRAQLNAHHHRTSDSWQPRSTSNARSIRTESSSQTSNDPLHILRRYLASAADLGMFSIIQGRIQGVSRVSGHPPFWLGCLFESYSVNKYHWECTLTILI